MLYEAGENLFDGFPVKKKKKPRVTFCAGCKSTGSTTQLFTSQSNAVVSSEMFLGGGLLLLLK